MKLLTRAVSLTFVQFLVPETVNSPRFNLFMKLKLFVFATLALISIISINGQSPSKILKNAEKALGGQKIEAIESLYMEGEVSNPEGDSSGKYVMQTAQPDNFNQAWDLNESNMKLDITANPLGKEIPERCKNFNRRASRDLIAEAGFRNTLWLNYKRNKWKLSSGGNSIQNRKTLKLLSLIRRRELDQIVSIV